MVVLKSSLLHSQVLRRSLFPRSNGDMSSTFPRMNISVETIYEYARLPYGIPEQRLPEIRQFLESVNQDLYDYDNESSRLENQLLFLRTRHERSRQKAMALRSLLAPIHRLPNELLIQTFDYVCDIDCGDYELYELSKAPARLSAVCSRWRSLCLSHSQMWSKFTVDCSKGSKVENAVDLYLERSKQLLLTLELAYYPRAQGQPGRSAPFQELINCRARWRHVKLSLQVLSLSYLSGLNFPVLEYLNIDEIECRPGDLAVFADSPKL
ncbi:hypothetical protein GYMLUDRAFT_214537 [Collybiopsis luxurians FD-317 M1]|nr:hypothetical protein GYMLUDRAFT_214537 [Collybiopsis luxurians FD-317 M1]